MNDSEFHRFHDLLPFYVNGTLANDDQQFVLDFLKQHPEFDAEVKFQQAVRASVKAVAQDRQADTGLQRLLNSVRQERQSTQISWLHRLRNLCLDWGLTPAFAVMTVIVILQGGLLWQYNNSQTAVSNLSTYRSMPEITSRTDLKLTVDPNADFGHLVILLRKQGARIVNGPSEIGELWIALDDKTQLNSVIQQLRHANGVLDVIAINQGSNGR